MAFIESGKSFNKKENRAKLKKRMENLDTVQYPLRIPKNLYKKIKIKAAQEEVTVRSVFLDMIEEYLNK